MREAPATRHTQLEGPQPWMMRVPKMRARVVVLRIVATADVSAGETQPQMNPALAHRQAFLATVGARCHGTNLIEMRATIHCGFSTDLAILELSRVRYLHELDSDGDPNAECAV